MTCIHLLSKLVTFQGTFEKLKNKNSGLAESALKETTDQKERAEKRVEEAETRVETWGEEVGKWRARAFKAEEEAEVLRGKGREAARALENAEEQVRELQSALQVCFLCLGVRGGK
jgi:predicted  nucleic acid-binding Zn-ribbon protein